MQFNTVQERLDALNKDADTRSVMDCIDRPIRPLILQMNRVGVFTAFSCCGYSYDGEEEPKSHLENPNVIFVPPCLKKEPPNNDALELLIQLRDNSKNLNVMATLIEKHRPQLELALSMWKDLRIRNFVNVIVTARNLKWYTSIMPNNYEWGILFCNWKKGMWKITDGLKEAIHDYEGKLIAIRELTEKIKDLPSVYDEFQIVDGNLWRSKYHDGEWMIEPKQPALIKVNNNI